jgi:hypothetical protein
MRGNPRVVRVAALWCLAPLLLMIAAGGAPFVVLALLGGSLACYAMLRRSAGSPRTSELAAASQPLCELAFYLGLRSALERWRCAMQEGPSVTVAGPPMAAPSIACRPRTDWSTKPSATLAPTRNDLAGRPSTAMSAAPAPDWIPATTPTNWKRLARDRNEGSGQRRRCTA